MPRTETTATTPLVYSTTARAFHWIVALLVIITAPIGFIMVDRENTKISDEAARAAFEATTNMMYSWHKLIGVVILVLMFARLAYRLTNGAPASEPSLPAWQKGVSHAVHWTMYLLLLAVPIGGYLGISYGGYLDVFGVNLPGLVANKEGDGHDKIAEQIFKLHELGATVLLGLVALHLVAVFHHTFVKGDGVLARMWPGSRSN